MPVKARRCVERAGRCRPNGTRQSWGNSVVLARQNKKSFDGRGQTANPRQRAKRSDAEVA
jgi:hypothetical protein